MTHLLAKALLDFMHFAAGSLQDSPVHGNGHVTSLMGIKRKFKTENGVFMNSLLDFLSILWLIAFLGKQVSLSRFQLHLIVKKAEERGHVNQIMH